VARTANCSETQLALDAKGEVLLAWSHGEDGAPETIDRVEALILNRRRKAEGSPEVLSPTGRRAYRIALVADGRGDGALLWGLEGQSGGPVEASTRTPGRRFARAVALRGKGYPGEVAIDPTGTATALFDTRVPESSTHSRNGHWSAPVAISTGSVEEVGLAANSQGDLAAVWTTEIPPAPGEQFGSHVIGASFRVGGAAWQPTSFISPPHSRNAAISLGPRDAALAVWENERLARVEAAEFVP
jgi:hypothetical protein